MALSIDQMDLTNSGFDVGIVMQRDTVRRPVGDVGNAKSYPFPVLYQQVHDATVLDLFDPGIALAAPEPWVEAARDLERAGVKGISGGCGFMAIHQPAMAAAVDVPVFTSALLWVAPGRAPAGQESTHRHHDREQPGAGRRVLPGIGVVLGGHSRLCHRT